MSEWTVELRAGRDESGFKWGWLLQHYYWSLRNNGITQASGFARTRQAAIRKAQRRMRWIEWRMSRQQLRDVTATHEVVVLPRAPEGASSWIGHDSLIEED